MKSCIKLVISAAVYFTTSGGFLIGLASLPTATALETTAVATRDIVPNDSIAKRAATMGIPEYVEHIPQVASFHQDKNTEWSNKSVALVAAPSAQPDIDTCMPPFSVTTPTVSGQLKTDIGVEQVEYFIIGRGQTEDATTHKLGGNSFQEIEQHYQAQQGKQRWHSSILAEYRDLLSGITDRITAKKDAAVRCFKMVQDLGEKTLVVAKQAAVHFYHFTTERYFRMARGSSQKALVLIKHKATEFYKMSPSAMHRMGDIVSVYKPAIMGFYSRAKVSGRISSILGGYQQRYQDLLTGTSECLALRKNATKHCFVIAQKLVQKALAATKRDAMELYETSSSAMRRVGDIVSAYKLTVMGLYNGAKVSGRDSSILASFQDVLSGTSERLTLFKVTSKRCFRLVHESGQKYLAAAKQESTQFFKSPSDLRRKVISASKPVAMGYYKWAKVIAQNSSTLTADRDVSIDHLLAASMRFFKLGQEWGQKALLMTKRGALERFKSLNGLPRQAVSFPKPLAIKYYSWVKGFTRNSSILAVYWDVFIEHIVATKNAAIPCYRMAQDIGKKALAVAKREAIEFCKSSINLTRQDVSAIKQAAMEYYFWAKGVAQNSSILAAYPAVFTETTSELLVATKKAAMRSFKWVQDLGKEPLVVTKREFLEVFKSSNDLEGDGINASKPVVMDQLQHKDQLVVPCFTPTRINYTTCKLPKRSRKLGYR